jgi:quercetin dioxygenase-like cupin family protein
MTSAIVHPPGGGKGYDWFAAHTVVEVSAADSGGAFTLMEDNLKANFRLGPHLHREHAETFYILSGPIWFYLEDRWIAAETGTTIHIPPGVPHAAEGGEGGRMLMIYQPAGFDLFLAEMARMTDADVADEARMADLNARFDLVPLGDAPSRI